MWISHKVGAGFGPHQISRVLDYKYLLPVRSVSVSLIQPKAFHIMARLAAIAVLLSILAVANCRALEAEPESVVAISDEQGPVDVDPAVLQEAEAGEAIRSVPTVTVAEGILQLPSQRRPCRHGFLHRHLRWARHHGLSHRRGAFAGPGEARVHPAVLPEEPREVKLELEAVAEPDPDTRPDTDGEQKPFHGEEEVEREEIESEKAWKGEMLRRFRGHGLRFHHRHHHHEQAMAMEKDDGEHQEQQDKAEGVAGMHAKHFSRQFQHHHNGDHEEQEDKEEGAGDLQLQHVKMFSRHFHHHHGDKEQEQQDKEEGAEHVPVELVSRRFHHHHGDEEQGETASKHFFHHHHDSDNEVDEVEELARKLSKAIRRRSFSRGGMRHHHHHHAEEGGVRKWFKGLLNMTRF